MIQIGRHDQRLLVRLYRFLDAFIGSTRGYDSLEAEARGLLAEFPEDVREMPPLHRVKVALTLDLAVPPWMDRPTPHQYVTGLFEHHGEEFRSFLASALPPNVDVPYVEVEVLEDS